MFLKSLILKGFKSFADTTKLDFEPGVTVVVGPNGSGKSNLVDAISWVLGSQSPQSIRSGKMEDVIFQGSQKRSALGRAEVSLVFDNESGTIPLDFPEILISRTLFRTGESEYAINNSPCRLLDIVDVLSNGGMGKTQHTIVSQGEVDTVLNDRSEERRLIIEEAAGVLKHKQRRQKAEKRISDTDSDLARLGDLAREVGRQLEPLERQAEAAHKHGEMLEHLNDLRLFVAGEEIKGLKQEKEYLSQRHTEMKNSESELSKEQTGLSADIKTKEEKLNTFSQDTSGEDLANLESLKARTQAAINTLNDRSTKLVTETKVFGEHKQAKAENEELSQELKIITNQIKEYKSSQEGLQMELGDMDSIESNIKSLKTQISIFEKMENETEEELSKHKAELEEKMNGYKSNDDLENLQKELETKKTEKDRWASKLEGYQTSEDFITSVEAPFEAEILGNLVKTAEGYEQAVAAALGESVQAILPSNKEEATQILERLKEKGLTGLVFQFLESEKSTPSQDGNSNQEGNSLRAFVSVNPENLDAAKAEAVLDELLFNVLVADTWKEALQLHLDTGCIVVSLEGDKFSKRGWQLGASNSNVDTSLTSAIRKSNIAEAQANLSELEGLVISLDRKVSDLEESERAALVAQEILQAQIKSGTESLESVKSQKQEIQNQLAQLETESSTGIKLEELNSLREKTEVSLERQREIEIALSASNQKLSSLEEQLQEKPDHSFDKLGVIQSLSSFFSELEPRVESSLVALREKRKNESQESIELTEALEKDRRRKEEIDAKLAELRESVVQSEIGFAEISAHFENAVNNLEKDLESTLEAALQAQCPDLEEGKQAADRISEIEHELQLIGPVNHLALKEYENIKSRHDFLTEQMQDIKDARKELRKLIRSIDLEMANAFESAFTDIAASFAELFQIAFPGGEGNLSLSNAENMLEAGVEISARPGEKTIKRLSLLSGGERSLVALTFLFAVIKCRPAPFCILDEVDAALDDINLCRFLDLVKELTNYTQLLIISHQKRTMEAGDYLYGISMPTEGITKVISEKRTVLEQAVTA